MSDWLTVILLGIVEGLTEFVPVSSTGHLLIAEHWLTRQTDLFNIVIQSGAVLAVLPLFSQRIAQLARFHKDPAGRDYALKLLVAFVVTAVGGVILDKGGFKLPESTTPIAIALFVGGVLFIVVERALKTRSTTDAIAWSVAALVGVSQLVAAVFPGTSRSGAVILLMLACGVGRVAATEFAFLIGVPTILASSAYKVLQALRHPEVGAAPESWPHVALGFAVAALVSFGVVRWLLRYVQSHSFVIFGWYRIALALLLLALAHWPGASSQP